MITSIKEFKKINENMLHINLLDKYLGTWQEEEYRTKFEAYKSKIKGFKNSIDGYKIGDIIEFTAGYNDDIRYTTEILGFDEDNDIYLLWESYWAPIKNDAIRDIKLINNLLENKDTENQNNELKQVELENILFDIIQNHLELMRVPSGYTIIDTTTIESAVKAILSKYRLTLK